MTPAQVNTALIIIVPALCRLAGPESAEVNEATLCPRQYLAWRS